MSSRFFEGLEGRQLFSVMPITPTPGGNGPGPGNPEAGDRVQLRLRDQSCLSGNDCVPTADQQQLRIQDRLKDGSCKI